MAEVTTSLEHSLASPLLLSAKQWIKALQMIIADSRAATGHFTVAYDRVLDLFLIIVARLHSQPRKIVFRCFLCFFLSKPSHRSVFYFWFYFTKGIGFFQTCRLNTLIIVIWCGWKVLSVCWLTRMGTFSSIWMNPRWSLLSLHKFSKNVLWHFSSSFYSLSFNFVFACAYVPALCPSLWVFQFNGHLSILSY